MQLRCAPLFVALGACASFEEHPPVTNDSLGPASGLSPAISSDASADAASSTDASGEHCLPGTFDIDKLTTFGGNLEIAGSFRSAAVIAVGRIVTLTVENATGGDAASAEITTKAPTDSISFRMSGLAKGSYIVRAQADVVGSSAVGEVGDLDGYYDGVEASPIQVRGDAKALVLDSECKDKIVFGIGVTR